MNYAYHLVIYLSVYTIVAVSLNVVIGYCGRLTLAHAGFFSIGSYAYALATLKLAWGIGPSMALGIGLAAVLSLSVSLPAWRLRGDFFIMVSLAIQVLLLSLINNWTNPEAEPGTWLNLTNGPVGLAGVPRPNLFGYHVRGLASLAALSLVVAFVCVAAGGTLIGSPWGRTLHAMRDDELAARGLGKRVRSLKVQAFAVACGMVAVAGVLYAAYVGFVDPSLASLDHSILMLSMVLVGGSGNFAGPLAGAAVLLAIPEILRFFRIPDAVAPELRWMLYGLLLIVLMHLRPQGIAGNYRVE
jgi:branched-chain amino acid transport system permease protein